MTVIKQVIRSQVIVIEVGRLIKHTKGGIADLSCSAVAANQILIRIDDTDQARTRVLTGIIIGNIEVF